MKIAPAPPPLSECHPSLVGGSTLSPSTKGGSAHYVVSRVPMIMSFKILKYFSGGKNKFLSILLASGNKISD